MKKFIFSVIATVSMFSFAAPLAFAHNIWNYDNSRIVGTIPDDIYNAALKAQEHNNKHEVFISSGKTFTNEAGDVLTCLWWFPNGCSYIPVAFR